MKLGEYTAGAEHLVAMGNYENIKFTARVVVTPDEHDDADAVAAYANELVEKGLRELLERAMEASAEPDTYVETWLYGPPPEPPRRRAVKRK